MDWGLVRCKEEGKYGLRPRIYYRREFYYYAMISGFLFRLTWTLTAFIDTDYYPWLTSIGYGTLIGVIELFRRWQWAIIRVENEQVNNFEKYRNVDEIPEVTDYLEDRKTEESRYDQMVKTLLVKIQKTESEKV